MTIFGSSQRVNPGNLGMRLFQSAGVFLPWWNPDGATPGGVGGSCVGAYQAISMPNYLASLVNLANPGTNDLIEGNGAVPWAALTGWGFVAAALQWLDTGLASVTTWSMLIQFSSPGTMNAYLLGSYIPAPQSLFAIQAWAGALPGRVVYWNQANTTGVPRLLIGNLCIAGKAAYRNGVPDGGVIGPGFPHSAVSIIIGALNQQGAGAVLFSTVDIESVAIYDVTLTAPRVAAREARMVIL